MHTEEKHKQIISLERFQVRCSFCYEMIALLPSLSCTDMLETV